MMRAALSPASPAPTTTTSAVCAAAARLARALFGFLASAPGTFASAVPTAPAAAPAISLLRVTLPSSTCASPGERLEARDSRSGGRRERQQGEHADDTWNIGAVARQTEVAEPHGQPQPQRGGDAQDGE